MISLFSFCLWCLILRAVVACLRGPNPIGNSDRSWWNFFILSIVFVLCFVHVSWSSCLLSVCDWKRRACQSTKLSQVFRICLMHVPSNESLLFPHGGKGQSISRITLYFYSSQCATRYFWLIHMWSSSNWCYYFCSLSLQFSGAYTPRSTRTAYIIL